MSDQITKTHLTQQIDNLKNDIEQLTRQHKRSEDKCEISEFEQLKTKKMLQLKTLNLKLKDIYASERLQLRKQNEVRSVNRAIDSLEFGAAKKRNDPLAIDRAKQAKLEREQTRSKYMEFLTLEQNYSNIDPKTLPGNLFLHPVVLKTYGLCPYINIDYFISKETLEDVGANTVKDIVQDTENQVNNITELVYKLRLEWLRSQNDQGVVYFDLYNNIFQKTDLVQMEQNQHHLEKTITDFINDTLSDSQKQMYTECIQFITNYITAPIKTKRLKELYKTTINDLSVLYSETSLELHEYLTTRYNYTIVVNTIPNHKPKLDKFQRCLLVEQFNKLLTAYREQIHDIQNRKKFYTNTLKNLNSDLYSFLTDKATFVSKNIYLTPMSKPNFSQKGKYFKKWSTLTAEEQNERFESFATSHVYKLTQQAIVDKQPIIAQLTELLQTNYQNKKLMYKDLSWNVKTGIITRIKTLTQNDQYHFSLTNTDLTNDTNIVTQTSQSVTDPVTEKKHTRTQKKRTSEKTIINKQSEKIINEELLYYIVRRVQNKSSETEVESNKDKADVHRENFIEHIKTKLTLKKITANDKQRLYNKYNEVYNLIISDKTR